MYDKLKYLAEVIVTLGLVFGIIALLLYTVDFIMTWACPCIHSCVGCYYSGGICQYADLISMTLVIVSVLSTWIAVNKNWCIHD